MRIGVTMAIAAACASGPPRGHGPVVPPPDTTAAPNDDGAAPMPERGAARGADRGTGRAPSKADAPAVLDPQATALLAAHNRVRAQHCAAPLAWSAELAAVAQKWADHLRHEGCAFEHSQTDYGENLAAGSDGALDADGVVGMWYGEIDKYDFRRGGFSMETGHFTQVVWRGTTKVGCGTSRCSGMTIWVCNYDPAGNVEGEYRENVEPRGCR